MTAQTDNIQIVHTGDIHVARWFSSTALCGVLLHGRIRPTRRPSTCPDCVAAR